ncbi:MAG: hypothetical protein ACPL07_01250 [Candidatus Bathyarchaeia archaeon]
MENENKYSMWTVDEEFYGLEKQLLDKASRLVQERDAYELAKMLVLIDKEVYRYEEEARRLRLKGELNLDVYRELVSSFSMARQKLFKLVNENKLSNDVSKIYRLMRFSNEVAGLYLTEYLQEIQGL